MKRFVIFLVGLLIIGAALGLGAWQTGRWNPFGDTATAGKDGKKMVSAGLMATHQKKLDRYALLAALAERQTQDGLRTSAPMILPVAVSTHGEFCSPSARVAH
jgi:hypothetical protein